MKHMSHYRNNLLRLVPALLWFVNPYRASGVEFESFNNWGGQVTFEGGRTDFDFADIDGDGWLEFLSIGDHGSPNINAREQGIMTFFNRQRGRSWQVVMEGNFGYGGIATGDLNGDGEWDVGYGMHHPYNQGDLGNQMIEAALGNGRGRNWQPWDDGLGVPRQGDDWYGMFGTDLGDFDNDGRLDLGSNSFGSGTGLHIYRNRGDGTWEDVYYFFGNNNSDMFFYFADFNNDGHLDVGAALHNRSLFFGDGTGRFNLAPTDGLPEQPFFGYLQGGTVGDIDRDGADDIVFCNVNYGLSVYRFNVQQGRWESLSANLPQQAQYYIIAELADFDRDGWLDIVAQGPQGIEVWLQRPGQQERWRQDAVIQFQDFRGLNALRCADLDHNGHPDILAMVNIRQGLFNNQNFLYILYERSEPEELSLQVEEPGGGEVFRMGSVRFIRWISTIPEGEDAGRVDIHFSPQGEQGEWEAVAEDIPNSGFAQWTIPRRRTDNGVLRLTIRWNDEEIVAYSRPFTILPGRDMPILEVEPSRIDFGVVELNREVRQAVILRNTGNQRLSFDSIRVRAPFRWMMEMIDLEPGDETEGRIIFSTNREGLFWDTLRIYSNGGNAFIPLLARTPNARGPVLAFHPDTLEFGRVHVDSSLERVAYLVNVGDQEASVTLTSLPDLPFQYPAFRNEILPPGDSIRVSVVFTPPRARLYEGSVRALSLWSEASLYLRGTGYGQPTLIAYPNSVNFGRVFVSQFIERVLSITNVGDEEARIFLPGPRVGSYRWRTIADTVLSPGDTLSIVVRFVPQQEGVIRDTLKVTYQVETLKIPVIGVGFTGAFVTTDAETLNFGEVLINQRSEKQITLRNRGNSPAVISIEPRRMGAFTWEGLDSAILQPRENLSLTVTFSPWWDTLFTDQLTAAYQNDTLTIVLLGRGVRELSIPSPPMPQMPNVSLFPNPFNPYLTVRIIPKAESEVRVQLWGVDGRLVREVSGQALPNGVLTLTIDGTNLPPALYLLRVSGGEIEFTSKVVLMK